MGTWQILTAIIQSDFLQDYAYQKAIRFVGELSSNYLRVEEFIAPNVLVFSTTNALRAGKRIEEWLKTHFKSKKKG